VSVSRRLVSVLVSGQTRMTSSEAQRRDRNASTACPSTQSVAVLHLIIPTQQLEMRAAK